VFLVLKWTGGAMVATGVPAATAPSGACAQEVKEEVRPGPEGSRVTVSGVGCGTGGGWDTLQQPFRMGNRWTLEQLHRRVTQGPAEWTGRP
jgi:hypothetical protein